MSVGGEAFAQTQNLVRRSGMVRDHALSFGAVLDPHIDPEQKVRQPVSDGTKLAIMFGMVAIVVAVGFVLYASGLMVPLVSMLSGKAVIYGLSGLLLFTAAFLAGLGTD